jgi:hypothetical protein
MQLVFVSCYDLSDSRWNPEMQIRKSLGDLSFFFEWLKQVEEEWVSQHTQLSS